MLRPRSGLNAVVANGCLHAWGGESAAGMFPDHDYYDPAAGGGTEVGGSSGSLLNQVFRPTMRCE